MKILSQKNSLILIVLFIIALAPRLYQLDQTTIYPDEITWTVRGKELVFALKQQNWKYFDSVWWKSTKENESMGLPLTLVSGSSTILFGQGESKSSLNLFPSITAARIPIAILNALLIPLFYLLARRFVYKKVAFFSAILLAFDPIHLAISRWVMLDGLLTLFIISSFYFFILALENRKWIPLAGLCLSLAFLTKPLGILPIISWSFILLMNKQNFKKHVQVFLGSIMGFLFFTWLLLPGSWDKPIIAILEYISRQKSLGQEGYLVFFMGVTTNQPPFYYYLFQILTRLPTLIISTLILSVITIFRNFQSGKIHSFVNKYQYQIALTLFFLSFLIAISFTPLKLGARYALPLWPGIYLLAMISLNKILSHTNRKSVIFLISFLLISSLWTIKNYFPNYYFFYNNLIGGPANAQKYDLVGHCLGTKPSLEYVNRCYSQEKSVTILGCSTVSAPYYLTRALSLNQSDITIVEYTYKQLLSNPQTLNNLEQQKPVYTATANGAIISQVYTSLSPIKKTCL